MSLPGGFTKLRVEPLCSCTGQVVLTTCTTWEVLSECLLCGNHCPVYMLHLLLLLADIAYVQRFVQGGAELRECR